MCLAIPGLIQSVEAPGARRHGCVSFGGAERRVDLSLVPEAGVGDYVMIHVGIALSIVDEVEARAALELWDEINAAMQDARPDRPASATVPSVADSPPAAAHHAPSR